MQTKPITIDVSIEAAKAFRNAPPALLRHIQEILELWLVGDAELDESGFNKATETLEQTIDEIGASARKRGLTDEILDSVLNESKT